MIINSYTPQRQKFNVQAVPFDLYLKNREVRQMSEVLTRLVSWPATVREQWLAEHGELIEEAIHTMVEDSNQVLSFVPLEGESMKLSQDLVENIQDTMDLWDSVHSPDADSSEDWLQ